MQCEINKLRKITAMSQETVNSNPQSAVGVAPNKVFTVTKRNGQVVDYDIKKVVNAISKCFSQTKEGGEVDAMKVAIKVDKELNFIMSRSEFDSVFVEKIQDLVEKHLMLEDYIISAKSYILYRDERNKSRPATELVTPEIKNLFNDSKKYFRNQLAEFVYYRSYSKWIDEKNRRETWVETVQRFMDYMREEMGAKITEIEYAKIHAAILTQRVIPSMRLLWAAGPAARKTHVAAYNCSYVAITDLRDFAEIMYVAMCGTGVGFSVENKFISQLPSIKKQTGDKLPIQEFTLEEMCENPSIIMIAKRGSGKSWITKSLIYKYKKIPVGVIISPTDKDNGPD